MTTPDDTPNNPLPFQPSARCSCSVWRDAEDASVLGEFKDRGHPGVRRDPVGNNPRMAQADLGTALRPFCPATSRFRREVPGTVPPARLPGWEPRRGSCVPIVVSFAPRTWFLRLFEHEVPEISEGLVSINSIARSWPPLQDCCVCEEPDH